MIVFDGQWTFVETEFVISLRFALTVQILVSNLIPNLEKEILSIKKNPA